MSRLLTVRDLEGPEEAALMVRGIGRVLVALGDSPQPIQPAILTWLGGLTVTAADQLEAGHDRLVSIARGE